MCPAPTPRPSEGVFLDLPVTALVLAFANVAAAFQNMTPISLRVQFDASNSAYCGGAFGSLRCKRKTHSRLSRCDPNCDLGSHIRRVGGCLPGPRTTQCRS